MILVTGANGLAGSAVIREFAPAKKAGVFATSSSSPA
jgi:uncharacterized protein YbjT (DUF2867 family)